MFIDASVIVAISALSFSGVAVISVLSGANGSGDSCVIEPFL
jgi:hypothetical protein